MERIMQQTHFLQPWNETPISVLPPQMIQEVLSRVVSTPDRLSVGGATRVLRGNTIALTRSEYTCKIETFREIVLLHLKTLTKEGMLSFERLDQFEKMVNKISTRQLLEASSFAKIKMELFSIEKAFVHALSSLPRPVCRSLEHAFHLNTYWLIDKSSFDYFEGLIDSTIKLIRTGTKRESWRTVNELAEYLFKVVYVETTLRHLKNLDVGFRPARV